MPGGHVGRIGSHVLHASEKILQRRCQADRSGGVRQELIDLLHLRIIRIELARFGLGLRDLIGQKLVVGAAYRINLHPLANEPDPGRLRGIGRLNDLLAGIAGRGGITDIVASNKQPVLSGVKRA